MALERVIKDLLDLREAAAQAARDGVCKIRLASGETLLIYPIQGASPGEEIHDVTDPAEQQVVLSCLRPGGKTYSEAEAREELKRRLAARGIGKGHENT